MPDAVAPHEFQYTSAEHQHESALAGIWLFLATEMLFFGGLFLAWVYSRYWNQAGFDAGARQTELWIGTLNTAILVTSSFSYSLGVGYAEIGDRRRLTQCCAATLALGVAFLLLKFGLEYHDDLEKHLFPSDPAFPLGGELAGGAKLFFVFYFVATALHGVHMVIGIGLVTWVLLRTRRGAFSRRYYTPVEVVGLYWSFVDLIWLILWPLIYLVGRR